MSFMDEIIMGVRSRLVEMKIKHMANEMSKGTTAASVKGGKKNKKVTKKRLTKNLNEEYDDVLDYSSDDANIFPEGNVEKRKGSGSFVQNKNRGPLLIPERFSHTDIHEGAKCSSKCKNCGITFGLFDTPRHVHQFKHQYLREAILHEQRKISLNSCLCDCCYRIFLNLASSIVGGKFKSKCIVENCRRNATNNMPCYTFHFLRTTISQFQASYKPEDDVPFCQAHYSLAKCVLCKIQLTEKTGCNKISNSVGPSNRGKHCNNNRVGSSTGLFVCYKCSFSFNGSKEEGYQNEAGLEGDSALKRSFKGKCEKGPIPKRKCENVSKDQLGDDQVDDGRASNVGCKDTELNDITYGKFGVTFVAEAVRFSDEKCDEHLNEQTGVPKYVFEESQNVWVEEATELNQHSLDNGRGIEIEIQDEGEDEEILDLVSDSSDEEVVPSNEEPIVQIPDKEIVTPTEIPPCESNEDQLIKGYRLYKPKKGERYILTKHMALSNLIMVEDEFHI